MKSLFFSIYKYPRKIIYSLLYIFDAKILNRKAKISILCYHSIATPGWRFSVSNEEFKNQIRYLRKEGFSFITLDDVSLFLEKKKDITVPSVVINFDDGYKDILEVKEFLKDLSIKPTLFVLSDKKHANREQLANDKEFMTREDVLSLKNDGWIIGSHSATHSDFHALTSDRVEAEVIDSKKDLEKELGFPIDYLAYPRGRYTDEVLAAMKKAGFKLGLSMDDSELTKYSHPYIIPRIGVDSSHTLIEYKASFSPSVVQIRRFLKKYLSRFL